MGGRFGGGLSLTNNGEMGNKNPTTKALRQKINLHQPTVLYALCVDFSGCEIWYPWQGRTCDLSLGGDVSIRFRIRIEYEREIDYPRQGSNLRPFAPEANALIH